MRRNHQLEVVLRELRRAGRRPISVVQTRHVKVTWLAPDGRTQTYVVANSSSSATGVANARATIRRMLALEDSITTHRGENQ